jgi:TolB-like protein/tetratricopeptide (TPR) repeat protein
VTAGVFSDSRGVNSSVIRFKGFACDLRARELRKGMTTIRLQEQPFQILAMLLERPGEVVTRDEIRKRLWPDGTTVDFEHGVNAAIKRLRAALDDSADAPCYVETLHRRGYRFIAPLEPAGSAAAAGEPVGAPRRPRLVVLPFTNLTSEAEHDYFSDGLTEEMIAQLGQRCASRIGVIARHSAMLYKNAQQGAAEIGETLRADFLVEGSVRRAGDRVRITAQLIETKGETHVWARSYDRQLADVLAVQTEVAAEIARALTHEILPPASPGEAETRSPVAYQAYLTGRFHWNKPGASGLLDSVRYYDEALAIDPAFSQAHSARARSYLSMVEHYLVSPREALQTAGAAAKRALALNPSDPDAHIVLAEVYRVLDWNWTGARGAYERALAINPNSEAGLRYYAWFLASRQAGAEAFAAADRGCEIDPLCLVMHTGAAAVRYMAHDYAGAIARCRRAIKMESGWSPARRLAAASLVQLGRHDEALDEFEALGDLQRDPVSLAWMGHALAAGGHTARAREVLGQLERTMESGFVSAFHVALLYAGLGDAEAAFAQLTRACDTRDTWLEAMNVEPRFAPLRGDSRFSALLARIGLDVHQAV